MEIISVYNDFPEINIGINKVLDLYDNSQTFENAEKLADKYNNVVKSWAKLNRGTEKYCYLLKRDCSDDLAEHILKQVTHLYFIILYSIHIDVTQHIEYFSHGNANLSRVVPWEISGSFL